MTAAAEADLAAFLRERRWFGAKSRALESAAVERTIPLPGEPRFALAVVRVAYSEGGEERYQLLIEAGERGGAPARLDAVADPRAARALLRATAGEIAALAAAEPRPLSAEQTNSSIRFGDEAVLKLFRKLEPGPNPDAEVTRFLTQRGCPHVPRFLGALEDTTTGTTLAVAQAFVKDGRDAWAETLEAARRTVEVAELATATGDVGDAARGEALRAGADQLGKTTAEVHRCLASEPSDPDFAPKPVTAADVKAWTADVSALLARVTRALDSDRATREGLERAVEERRRALDRAQDLGRKIRT
ncbi:MAG TPA: hypothetical protein VHF22_02645, partial [Planctomycetota bacterium]|nr:hypothetical protein [Planctomycetota bacterium]